MSISMSRPLEPQRGNVVDLTHDSDPEIIDLRDSSSPTAGTPTASKMALSPDLGRKAVAVIDANVARENRSPATSSIRHANVVSEITDRTNGLVNGTKTTTITANHVTGDQNSRSVDHDLSNGHTSPNPPTPLATAETLTPEASVTDFASPQQPGSASSSSGRKRREPQSIQNSAQFQSRLSDLQDEVSADIGSHDFAGPDQGIRRIDEGSARKVSVLSGKAIVQDRRQLSPTPMRPSTSHQTPIRFSTGGRLKSRPTGEPGILPRFENAANTPSTSSKRLSTSEMIALIENYLTEVGAEHEYFTKTLLRLDNMKSSKFATKCGRYYCAPVEHFETESPIKDMHSIALPKGKQDVAAHGKLTQQIWRSHNMKALEQRILVPLTKHEKVEPLPRYASYTSLRRNVLAEDDDKLRYFPYFGEDEEVNELDMESLHDMYKDWIKKLPTQHKRSELAATLSDTATKYLNDTGLSIVDAAHYLIGNIEDILPPSMTEEQRREAERQRKSVLYHDFEIDFPGQKLYLKNIPPPTRLGLDMAYEVCKAWKDATSISLWDCLKDKKAEAICANAGKQHLAAPEVAQPRENAGGYYSIGTMYSMKCLICFTHECPGHPHVFEYLGVDMKHNLVHPLIDSKTNPFRNDEVCSDLCFLQGDVSLDPTLQPWTEAQEAMLKTSFTIWRDFERASCLIALIIDRPCADIHMMLCQHKASAALEVGTSEGTDQVPPLLKEATVGEKRKRSTKLLDRDDIGQTATPDRPNFRPCNHLGPCVSCECVNDRVVCEKTCRCPPNCPRRWRGCSCSKGGARVCGTNSCECYKMNRECDPDLCGTCGAPEILDPINRYNDEVAFRACVNVGLQRNRPKRTLLGASNISGYGLFIGESAKAGEFLGEYKGELISNDEAERRGVVYDARKTSYLFNINNDNCVDASRAGNKFRFINHSKVGENVGPKLMFANGVHRIAMYARRDLVEGEELYFNYGYNGKQLKFVQKEIDMPNKSLPAHTARPRNRSGGGGGQTRVRQRNGKKGGPRPGAGRKPGTSDPTVAASTVKTDQLVGEEESQDAGGVDLYAFDANGALSDLEVPLEKDVDDTYAETSQYDDEDVEPDEDEPGELTRRRKKQRRRPKKW